MAGFTDRHGVEIVYDRWPAEHPRAVVQLLHGIGEHAGRYAELIEALRTAGYTVYADDHRGHGRTGLRQWDGDRSRLGRLGPAGIRAAVEDELMLGRLIRAEEPGLPVVLLGHSWGSLLAQIILDSHPHACDAVVLSGTAYRMPGWMRGGDFNRRFRHDGDTGHEWLSRDPAVSRAFADDPLTFDADVFGLFGLRDALRLLGRPARDIPVQVPVLILVGDEDPLGGGRSARRLARAYRERSGLRDVTPVVYPGARHEVFNETNKERVRSDLLSWLDERMPSPWSEAG